jgi:predicted DNA-binding ribbon-helix-helix protein
VQGKTVRSAERAIKRSIKVGGRSISVSLEDAFWEGFRDLLCAISSDLQAGGLSSAVRVYILKRFRALAETRSKIIG